MAAGLTLAAGAYHAGYEQGLTVLHVGVEAAYVEAKQLPIDGKAPAPAPKRRAPAPAATPRKTTILAAPAPENDLPPVRQKILDALAWLEAVRLPSPDKRQVAFLAGASPRSSAYTNNLGALRSAQLIDYPSPGRVALTDTGRALATSPARPGTALDLQDMVRARLSPSRQRIVDVLLPIYPSAIAKNELAVMAGASPRSSAFTNNLGALRSLGLVDYPATGQVAACPVLFLE